MHTYCSTCGGADGRHADWCHRVTYQPTGLREEYDPRDDPEWSVPPGTGPWCRICNDTHDNSGIESECRRQARADWDS